MKIDQLTIKNHHPPHNLPWVNNSTEIIILFYLCMGHSQIKILTHQGKVHEKVMNGKCPWSSSLPRYFGYLDDDYTQQEQQKQQQQQQ